ncbi:uncharacterized protein LOC128195490 isoform X1 [Vigna angularis]|uniref:uncharacterized protein LOC128195490 isoform X1 n=1 Tax=Phaseolus angularis TaxID=3914 RepID=UPI0022B4B2CB|nr:uncharacterized protein LOC128195490 isoform X1 [Vigna angularis]
MFTFVAYHFHLFVFISCFQNIQFYSTSVFVPFRVLTSILVGSHCFFAASRLFLTGPLLVSRFSQVGIVILVTSSGLRDIVSVWVLKSYTAWPYILPVVNPFRLIGVGLPVWTLATLCYGFSFDFWSISVCCMQRS